MTRPSRESNPVPTDSESEGQPTRLIWHQKREPLKDLYASKIRCDCVPIPAGASSVAKIVIFIIIY